MPLNLDDLERLAGEGCQMPGCDHANHDRTLWLHGRCHPSSPTWASYEGGTGVLKITCAACKKVVAEVTVERATPRGDVHASTN